MKNYVTKETLIELGFNDINTGRGCPVWDLNGFTIIQDDGAGEHLYYQSNVTNQMEYVNTYEKLVKYMAEHIRSNKPVLESSLTDKIEKENSLSIKWIYDVLNSGKSFRYFDWNKEPEIIDKSNIWLDSIRGKEPFSEIKKKFDDFWDIFIENVDDGTSESYQFTLDFEKECDELMGRVELTQPK